MQNLEQTMTECKSLGRVQRRFDLDTPTQSLKAEVYVPSYGVKTSTANL